MILSLTAWSPFVVIGLLGGALSGCDEDMPSAETGGMCFDGRDNDGDGQADCDDRDCATACVESSCFDGIDDDRDGATDCLDDDCRDRELCFCDDGLDNDADGRIDCVDTDCDELEACDAPQGMRVLFGRSFTKGCGNPEWPQSQPSHSVTVPDFLIDTDPANVGDYRRCVQAGACEALLSWEDGWNCTYGEETAPSVPLRCGTWQQADAYCRWRGQRLCSESEWEFAFRLGGFAHDLRVVLYDAPPDRPFGEDPPPVAAEPVADCWRPTYGEIRADGSHQISVPTDGSPVLDEPCSGRAVRVHARNVDDDHCYRTSAEPAKPYVDLFIRCCGDIEAGD